MLFGLGNLFYGKPSPVPSFQTRANPPSSVSILLVNAIAILSEDRFLARSRSSSSHPRPDHPIRWPLHPASPGEHADRVYVCVVGWGNTQQSEPGFGASNDTASVKAKIVNLIASVRTLMRSMLLFLSRAGV